MPPTLRRCRRWPGSHSRFADVMELRVIRLKIPDTALSGGWGRAGRVRGLGPASPGTTSTHRRFGPRETTFPFPGRIDRARWRCFIAGVRSQPARVFSPRLLLSLLHLFIHD